MSGKSRLSRVLIGALVLGALLVALGTSLIPVRRAHEHQAENSSAVDPTRVRPPAVAGQFYPAEPEALKHAIDEYLAEVPPAPIAGLRALVVPHAGYRFSGPTAAYAYQQLRGRAIRTVYVLAPSHHVSFVGVSVPDVDAYRTPLGLCRLSPRAATLRDISPFTTVAAAHLKEHSLEVQLPFLQRVLPEFELVPLLFGKVDPRAVAQVLAADVKADTLLIASSDLSHYYPYEKAEELDGACVSAIEHLDIAEVANAEACGKLAVLTVLHLARKLGWKTKVLDYRNSGDTTGSKERVVGYAAVAFYESSP